MNEQAIQLFEAKKVRTVWNESRTLTGFKTLLELVKCGR